MSITLSAQFIITIELIPQESYLMDNYASDIPTLMQQERSMNSDNRGNRAIIKHLIPFSVNAALQRHDLSVQVAGPNGALHRAVPSEEDGQRILLLVQHNQH